MRQKKYYNIPQEDYFAFKLGETLFYKSNTIKTDTLYISYFSSDYNESDKTNFSQELNISLKIESQENFVNSYFIQGGVSSINWFKIYLSIYSDSIVPINYSLNNNVIPRVYVVSNINQLANPDITAIYFCMKYGVIRYDKKDGEYYELQMK